jgi:hypothetical protein
MDRQSTDFVRDVLITIHSNIRELRERKNFADDEEQSYIDGKLQAYNEVVECLRSSAKEFGIDAKEVGL